MNERDRFYEIRDRRSVEYGFATVFDVPVAVFVGDEAAQTVVGQQLVVTLINMLARLHRNIRLSISDAPLLASAGVPGTTLMEAAVQTARLTDPYIKVEEANSSHFKIAIGIGADAPAGLPWYIGCERQIAKLDVSPQSVGEGETQFSLGAALAACFGAAVLSRQVLGVPTRPTHLSAWNLREGENAVLGPALLPRLNVGNVLIIGAGGVGSCFAYWLSLFEHLGLWWVMDGDVAELNDSNRCLGILPSNCGWPNSAPDKKAKIAANIIGGIALDTWYDAADLDSLKPDLVLALANERGVRTQIMARGEPIVLHATTSQTWEAQLHRHIPDRDDCLVCRMPAKREKVQFTCSTVEVGEVGSGSSDAALPFLSATAGLMLLSGLFRLEAGELLDEQHNLWALCFSDLRRATRQGICSCKPGCSTPLPTVVRQRINAGRRWSYLDR